MGESSNLLGHKKPGVFEKGDPRINRKGRPKDSDFVNKRDYKLYLRYGIRLSEYNDLFEKQGGVCAICGEHETKMQARKNGGEKTIDSLQVDHDWKTGKVRGLICWKCNVGVVKAFDNKELAMKAAEYLNIELKYNGR